MSANAARSGDGAAPSAKGPCRECAVRTAGTGRRLGPRRGPAAAERAPGTGKSSGALLIARGRVVPVGRLVAGLWEDEPPAGAVGAVRTFVAAL
ncbi:hypothetical protein SBADM41S_09775 [Streptomyces badius]